MTTLYRRKHRDAIPPPAIVPPARDTVESLPDLDDGEAADSGIHVISPERAATMRAEWAASAATDPCPPSWESVLDAETALPAIPGGYL